MSTSKHILSLEIPDTNNCKVFRVFDTSTYSSLIQVKCPTLEITSPGFSLPISIDIIQTGFNYVLNACTLGIQTVGCGDTSADLPDGIYTVRYSVSPNDKVFVEYKHLRVTKILNKYYKQLCDLEIHACEPTVDTKAKLDELRLIKSFVDAAKAKVEECLELQKGMDLLQYANKRLDKYIGSFC